MILQNVLNPDQSVCDVEEMYWRHDGKQLVSNTYFNLFVLHKWLEYTVIKKFYLSIKVRGSAILRIFDQNGCISTNYINNSIATTYEFELPYKEASRYIWFSFEALDETASFEKAAYITKDKPLRRVHLAADICTFKREKYLINNLNLLKRTLIENPANPLYKKFDLFVVDNGNTLNKETIENEEIHLYPNMNAGGSGGFTRGLIEINKAKEKYDLTHVIFMDDDAILCPDSFVRVFAVLSYVNDKYKKACISGAALRDDVQYCQIEYGPKWETTHADSRYPGLDLRSYSNVIKNEEPDQADYAPFWFACYPLEVATLNNLPLPMFLHFDDIEYGIRNKKNHIMLLNGVCVWSPGFENKKSSALNYYEVRNILVTESLYQKDSELKIMKKYCLKRIEGNVIRYRYRDSKLILEGIRDFCRGPAYLGTLDPVKKNQELIAEGYKFVPVEQLTKDKDVLKDIYQYKEADHIDQYYSKEKQFGIKHLISLNGWLLPSDKRLAAFPVGEIPYHLFRKGRIILFDPGNHKGIYGEKKFSEFFKSFSYYFEAAKMLNENYEKVGKEFKDKFSWLTSYDCWKEYLKLSD